MTYYTMSKVAKEKEIMRIANQVQEMMVEKYGLKIQIKINNRLRRKGRIIMRDMVIEKNRIVDGNFEAVELNANSLNTFEDLIETLAHEYAHVDEWEHTKQHAKITKLNKQYIKAKVA